MYKLHVTSQPEAPDSDKADSDKKSVCTLDVMTHEILMRFLCSCAFCLFLIKRGSYETQYRAFV